MKKAGAEKVIRLFFCGAKPAALLVLMMWLAGPAVAVAASAFADSPFAVGATPDLPDAFALFPDVPPTDALPDVGGVAGPQARLPAPDPEASDWVVTDQLAVRLVSAVTATGSGGAVPMGLEFRLMPGWKVYWRSAGDAGFAPEVDWAGSTNIGGVEMDYPVPEHMEILGFQSFGYRDAVIYPLSVDLADPSAGLSARGVVEFLTCEELCIPGRAELSLDLPPGKAVPSAHAHDISRFAAQVPAPTPAAAGMTVTDLRYWHEGDGAVVRLVLPRLTSDAPDMLVETPDGASYAAGVTRDPDGSATFTQVLPGGKPARKPPEQVRVTVIDGPHAFEQTLTAGDPPAPPARTRALAGILGLALLGGLILNLMPCVLPVLSLKLMALLRHPEMDCAHTRMSLLLTSAGIVTAFAALGGLSIGLREAGVAVGWGLHFQNPWFLGVMALLMVLFAANLFDLFEVRLPAAISDVAAKRGGAFATGVFATLLATPCSAPFLGTAVAFALVSPAPVIMAVFATLGLGMALPYLAVAVRPQAVSLLPRPGPWMAVLRRVMGAALLLTALWLGWLLGTVSGLSAPAVEDDAAWQPFSRAVLAEHVAAGQTVLVDVTADWCLTCQVNKVRVLQDAEVTSALDAAGVVRLRADWTRPDEAISAYLAHHGRYGIPFNAVYGPAAPQGIVLPELLGSDALLQAVATARGGP